LKRQERKEAVIFSSFLNSVFVCAGSFKKASIFLLITRDENEKRSRAKE